MDVMVSMDLVTLVSKHSTKESNGKRRMCGQKP